MLVRMKKKSQITIPSVIVKKMGLKENEVFDLQVDGEKIILHRTEITIKSSAENNVKKIRRDFRFSALANFQCI